MRAWLLPYSCKDLCNFDVALDLPQLTHTLSGQPHGPPCPEGIIVHLLTSLSRSQSRECFLPNPGICKYFKDELGRPRC